MCVKTFAMHSMARATLRAGAAARVLVFVLGMGVVKAQVYLSVQPGVQLSWLTKTNDTYNVQLSSNPVCT